MYRRRMAEQDPQTYVLHALDLGRALDLCPRVAMEDWQAPIAEQGHVYKVLQTAS